MCAVSSWSALSFKGRGQNGLWKIEAHAPLLEFYGNSQMNYQPRYNQFDKFRNELQCYANILLDQRSYYPKTDELTSFLKKFSTKTKTDTFFKSFLRRPKRTFWRPKRTKTKKDKTKTEKTKKDKDQKRRRPKVPTPK